MTSKFDDTCRAAADKLIASIAAGDAGDWRVPWRSPAGLVSPINAATGNRYEAGNWILAMLTAFDHGWTCGRWGTYKQWQSLGRQVARGERGTQLVRWVPAKKKADADSRRRRRPWSAAGPVRVQRVRGRAAGPRPRRFVAGS